MLLPLNQTGPPGPAGAGGPSTAYVTERVGGITPTDKSLSLKKTTGTILSLNVPAVGAKLSASLLGSDPASVACRLDAGSASCARHRHQGVEVAHRRMDGEERAHAVGGASWPAPTSGCPGSGAGRR